MRREEHDRPDREREGPGAEAPGGDQESPAGSPPGEAVAESARADQDQLRTAQKERQARVAKVIVGLAIAVILMLFIIFNSKPARVSFVFATGHPPLIWVMFSCAVLGGILGYLVGRPGRQVNLRRHPKDERKS